MCSELKMTTKKKEVCRLCYYETIDTTDIFSEDGISFNYISKINKYLYFSVSENDELPKTVCWMCTQHLETFHKFYEKINEIQKQRLTTNMYESIILQPQYDLKVQTPLADRNEEKKSDVLIDDDGNTFEIVVISDDFEEKTAEVDNEFEEFELLEVDHMDSITDPQEAKDETTSDIQTHHSPAIDAMDVHSIDSLTVENEENVENIENTAKKEKISNQTNLRRNQKPNIKVEIQSTRKSARQAAKLQKSVQMFKREKRKSESVVVKRNPMTMKTRETYDIEEMQVDCDEIAEGESDNEFPARDSDNEDWPSQETLDEFPKQIMKDGLLLIKGKELMSMICRFYNLECKQCEKKQRFKKLNELFEHYGNIHDEPGYVECCQTKLSRYPAIIMHMARHLQPDAFKCDECGYIVTRPRFLQCHKLTHLPDDQKPFACTECSRRFCWKSALRIHMISHQPASERRQYICHVCDRTYDTPGGLSTHKKLAHSGAKPSQSNVCHICAKTFSTRTGLHEHMLTIHQPREKGQLQCTECGKWLMNSRCLKTHMILHSDAEFRCDQCDYVTKKKVLLNRHLLTQHSTTRPFVCNLCGRDFKMKRSLTVHIAQHGSTQKYQCPFCDRTFNSSTNFYTHRKSLHPKELEEMKQREEDERRRKRIEAGVEEDTTFHVTEIRDTQLILTTDTGEEYTVLEIT